MDLLVFIPGNDDFCAGKWSFGSGDKSAHCRASSAGANASPQHSACRLAGWTDPRRIAGCVATGPEMGSHPAHLSGAHARLWGFVPWTKISAVPGESASAQSRQHAPRANLARPVVSALAHGDGRLRRTRHRQLDLEHHRQSPGQSHARA